MGALHVVFGMGGVSASIRQPGFMGWALRHRRGVATGGGGVASFVRWGVPMFWGGVTPGFQRFAHLLVFGMRCSGVALS